MNFKEAERAVEEFSLANVIESGDVLLVISPFVWTAAPLGGIHLLQAACREQGVTARVVYSNLHFCSLTGGQLHRAIAMEDMFLVEERLFGSAAYNLPGMGEDIAKLLDSGEVPDHIWPPGKPLHPQAVPAVETPVRNLFRSVDWVRLQALAEQWRRALAREIVKKQFSIVGCSTTHGGLAPAIALLQAVKEAAPNIVTCLGGALCETDMAEGILPIAPGVDFIFTGEADETFPTAAREILKGKKPAKPIVYGRMVQNLDNVPLPDYREYFSQRRVFLPDEPDRDPGLMIPYETSRGCWFGRCTFCGLMGPDNRYRKKSPETIVRDLKSLVGSYENRRIYITDNIIAPQYYKTLFTRLSREIPSLILQYEIKSNMTLDQLLSLKEAGVNMMQPGIESLSSPLLKRMDKGVTVRENIALLRYARSVNLDLKWNLLFGFPGDREEEYTPMLRLFPLVHHLQPPRMMIPVRICRYSKYYCSPAEYGISRLRPARVHQDLLPPQADPGKLAYLFAGEFDADSLDKPGLLSSFWEAYRTWDDAWATYSFLPLDGMLPKLHISPGEQDDFILRDTRGLDDRPECTVIDGETALLLLVARPLEAVPERVRKHAAKQDLAIELDSWFIPLSTAPPSLLQSLEAESKDKYR